jgi:hypothetical protein
MVFITLTRHGARKASAPDAGRAARMARRPFANWADLEGAAAKAPKV